MTGIHVGMCLIIGKKSTRVAAGEPDSTVRVAALSAGGGVKGRRGRERNRGGLTESDEKIIDRLYVATVCDVEDGCGSVPGWHVRIRNKGQMEGTETS